MPINNPLYTYNIAQAAIDRARNASSFADDKLRNYPQYNNFSTNNATSNVSQQSQNVQGELYDSDDKSGKNGKPFGSNSTTPWGLIAQLGVANLGGLISSFSPDYKFQELNGMAGYGTQYRNGIAYQSQNAVDSNSIMEEHNAKTMNQFASGNFLGGIGSLIWGGDKLRNEIEKQHRFADVSSAYNGNYASTLGMQQNLGHQYGNQ